MVNRVNSSITSSRRSRYFNRQTSLMASIIFMTCRGSSICKSVAANRFVNGFITNGKRRKYSNTCFVNHYTSSSACSQIHRLSGSSHIFDVQQTFTPSRVMNRSITSLHLSTKANAKSSSSSSSPSTKPKKSKSNPKKKSPGTGLLRLLPPLSPHTEIHSRATRQTYNTIKDDPNISNVKRRTQKRGAQTLDHLQQCLCRPLRETVETYRRLYRNMHPFERVVMDLTVTSLQKRDGTTLSTLLEEVNEARKEVMGLSKDWISKVKSASTAREAYEFTEEGKESVGRVFDDLLGECWGGMVEIQRALRKVPMVRLDCPAVVLVGAPNVGKSSIVRAISSGTPEVNNYPFTTRGMTLGHVQVFWESDADVAQGNVAGVSIPTEKDMIREKLNRRGIKSKRMELEDTEAESEATGLTSKKSFPISQLCQIMDSPGLLRREDGERNEMEQLTLAAMSHLPTAVMFVMDLSGGAGDKCSSVEDQLVLRKETRARFPRRPWIDVVSKVDLGIVDGAKERLMDILEEERLERAKLRGSDNGANDEHYFIELSIKEGQGVEELRQEVMRMLGEVRVVLDAMAAIDENSARA